MSILSPSIASIEYRTIERYPGYRFGSDGSAWTCWRKKTGVGNRGKKVATDEWRLLSPGYSNGYMIVRLCEVGRKTSITTGLHALILEAFVGPRPDGMECRHFPDNDRSNNKIENLSWGTRKQNHQDMWHSGTKLRGERSPMAKVTEKDVLAIREMWSKGIGLDVMENMFPIARTQIFRIAKKEAWAWL